MRVSVRMKQCISVLSLVWLVGLPILATAQSSPHAQGLTDANTRLNEGAYQPAKEILDAILADSTATVEERQRAHLLTIKLYVLAANDADGKGDDFNAEENRSRASREITRCLEIPELRNTLPNPPQDFPQPMGTLFEQVRAGLFGSFRVKSLEPKNAIVVLDGDTLFHAAGQLPAEDNVYARRDGKPVEHTVVIEADGYKKQISTFEIDPSTVYTPEFVLDKGCGLPCWALRGGIVAAAIGAGAILLPSGGQSSQTEQPLPSPPNPPGSPPY
jgi:hypothetical protein